MDFQTWPKIPRFNKPWEITEKLDGTNGVIYWSDRHDGRFDTSSVLAEVESLYLYAGSRNRWLRPESDNFGFARWAMDNAVELRMLGPGRHYGEWYGQGVQRGYGLTEKRFALFDWNKWVGREDELPKGVETVHVLMFADPRELNTTINGCINDLRLCGSAHVPGFMNPEGIVLRHQQGGQRFKVLLEKDDIAKGEV